MSLSILFFSSTAVIFNLPLKSPNSFLCQYDYCFFFFSLFIFVAEGSPQKENIFSVKKFTELLQIPAVFFLITVKIITGIPFGIFQSMFSLVSMEYFKLEPQQNGFVMSYVGGLSIVRLQINDKLVLIINGDYQKDSVICASFTLKKSQDNIERHNFMLPVRVILTFHPQFFLTLKKKEKS